MSIGAENDPAAQVPNDDGGRGPLDLTRLAWLVTTGTLLIGMTILAFKREWGYAGVTCAVALSAAINLL